MQQCGLETEDDINFLNQARGNAKRYTVTIAFLYHVNNVRMHVRDMSWSYHKEKHST